MNTNHDFAYYQALLAENVRNIREAKKQTRSAFAKNCGISFHTLKKIEDCMGNPRITILLKIARYANCETDQLLENDTISDNE